MKEILSNFNDQSAQNGFNQADVQKNKIIIAVCYVFSFLFFVPLLIDGSSSYCRFHANQQLTLFICEIILGIVLGIIGLIPVLGAIIGVLVGICMLALVIALAYGGYNGMAVRIPFVGNLINIF
ncbi:MAG: hypothetical protein IJY29_04215 [Ruminococcus sp.]|nr:hypothetical protein [Ruminococcus sp.]